MNRRGQILYRYFIHAKLTLAFEKHFNCTGIRSVCSCFFILARPEATQCLIPTAAKTGPNGMPFRCLQCTYIAKDITHL